ncbi:hypothetical protein [Aromatoleum sp.]|uniref:hypothetical protein n=1 Tax=Aromatoleum sp. TaxID=2307007 RepID=UPI002FC9ECCD
MKGRRSPVLGASIAAAMLMIGATPSHAQDGTARGAAAPRGAVVEAQSPRQVRVTRPEQRLTDHDRSPDFSPEKPALSSPAFRNQPGDGRMLGFDFARDPLNAKKPMQTFDEIMRADIAATAKVMQTQRALLESRYDLAPRFLPYLHGGRLLTLEDTVEFFNLVLRLNLESSEKADLVAFTRQV